MIRIILMTITLLGSVSSFASEQRFVSEGQPPQLIELYTSEGCSSCPPADERIGKLLDSPDLWSKYVPMTFHVDYWDYLGWQDRFAKSEFSQRQRQLKRSGQIRSVYTPGWVVDGLEWRGFFRGLPLPAAMQRPGGRLQADLSGDQLAVRYKPNNDQNGPLVANLSVLGFDYVTPIEGGENRGLRLEHQFVVLHNETSEGATTWDFKLPEVADTRSGRRALVVWISQGNQAQPVQVVGGWLE